MDFSVKKYIDYQGNTTLISAIMEVIAPSYKSTGLHVSKDIDICNELYVINSKDQRILAFFMVGYHQINDQEFCYLGLSTCRQEHKNRGFVKKLYFEFARDCIRKEIDINKRIICYWTTATPIVYHWFCKYFSDVQPDRQGNTSFEGNSLLTMIAQKKYKKADFEENSPFVLRHAAQQINYSEIEEIRIKEAVKDLNLTVFEKYNLDEKNGDRFLMFGYTPNHNRLIELTQ